jgi:hypothetical protein
VIQSVAAGIDQSPPLPALPPPDFEGVGVDPDELVELDAAVEAEGEPSEVDAPSPEPSLDPDPAVLEPTSAVSSPVFVPERFAAWRSFLAQPDPLKWIAGAAMAFRTGPLPHSGQDVGGSAWTPWITSKRRPQAAQS